jgi:hypothetical protein
MDWIKHILTGKDGETHDVARHSWVWTTLAIIAGGAWNAVHSGAVDLMQFAQAIGINTAAHGGAIFAKAKTEPDPASRE